jgi:hypothetical protein
MPFEAMERMRCRADAAPLGLLFGPLY